ncbi:glycine/D-amino acid oxidase-like deaminating enzyme [Mesoflavibacter sabulilitoris]|uniref:FAD-dependent oxidoreductase n=1 Tax=Mesoflavibacter zeaxanthinifaciens subsp. sabulilitoris TaxID=1520893 RepID=A0A2T1N6Z1_9FLAO|nr:FAD-dependent oxidoreductase [Mesoflavibacter zeaxanthinifaciens]MBB3123106.1 glycine/D-amino acid oxidase-like deaminating enzyme [Mesoflavibacter zeaxanthinifaciens subsp. sabulilitoris]PSG87250.1 FAD-dependent oxidoreductase [Mesoflavibacter zeaxanthinifaciens subsp. sabulilitoris]
MNFSYWEIKSWLTNIDFTIIGSGIVGLNCALQLKKTYPKANILILEKGVLPNGASTKNAGFACFGSLSEILDDLNTHTEAEVLRLINKRIKGLKLLRQTLGDHTINYQAFGGYELFTENDNLFENCLSKKDYINKLLKPMFKAEVFSLKDNIFNFKNIKKQYIFNAFEGQIDTGKMMEALLQKVQSKGIKILNNITVQSFSENQESVKVKTNQFEFLTSKLLIATNGFASQLNIQNVKPARAQVLITKPIKDLHIKGTFHLDQGYYYFRNINNRILFGGGRNLDFKTEETTEFAQTKLIQNKLETLLKTTILPETNFNIDHRWSGIMGVGKQKKAIAKQLSNNVFCGVRLGGMGVAIGSLIGKELADLTQN